ncbi:hypothetical protein BGZ58_006187 [Dissophora ornata]|nr:hypothetical protein BGZ58_006187 [Dissophora ornata]
MQVFFQPLTGGPIVKELLDKFTLNDFIMAASEALGYNSREILKLRFAVSNKNLDVKNEKGFDENKHFITKDCNIFVLGRLLGGWTLPDTLQAIAEQQLEDELDKVDTQTADCTICLDSETDCLKVCCAWMCRADFKSWLLDKQFKVSCTLCSKAIMFRDIFKTPEYVATLQALEDEKQLLKNIDCQRCFDCSTLLHNETMHSCQKCITCCREFCFFCNRNWNAETMRNQKYTCGKGCVYETMLYFEPIPFHYNKDMKIPNRLEVIYAIFGTQLAAEFYLKATLAVRLRLPL